MHTRYNDVFSLPEINIFVVIQNMLFLKYVDEKLIKDINHKKHYEKLKLKYANMFNLKKY